MAATPRPAHVSSGAADPALRIDIVQEIDPHPAIANRDREQAACFCGRLLVRSPYEPRRWCHPRLEEFFGYGGIPAADVRAGDYLINRLLLRLR